MLSSWCDSLAVLGRSSSTGFSDSLVSEVKRETTTVGSSWEMGASETTDPEDSVGSIALSEGTRYLSMKEGAEEHIVRLSAPGVGRTVFLMRPWSLERKHTR